MITPREDREFYIYCAKVYLREARARRDRPFSFVLLEWAANARQNAMAAPRLQSTTPHNTALHHTTA